MAASPIIIATPVTHIDQIVVTVEHQNASGQAEMQVACVRRILCDPSGQPLPQPVEMMLHPFDAIRMLIKAQKALDDQITVMESQMRQEQALVMPGGRG